MGVAPPQAAGRDAQPPFPAPGLGSPRPRASPPPRAAEPAWPRAPRQRPLLGTLRLALPSPRLTLQLGRRFAIGLKIAASPQPRLLAPGSRCPLPPRGPLSPPAPARLRSPAQPAAAAGRPNSAPLGSVRAAAMQRRGALFGVPGGSGSRKMAAGDIGELLVPHMPTIRVPRSGDRVYKTECAFSYDSPVSEAGLRCRRSGEVAVPAACAAASRGTGRHVKRAGKMRSGRGISSSGRRSWLWGPAVRRALNCVPAGDLGAACSRRLGRQGVLLRQPSEAGRASSPTSLSPAPPAFGRSNGRAP